MAQLSGTQAPLGANGVYTSAPVAFNSIGRDGLYFNATAYSDQQSAANGFAIQASLDGVSWYPVAVAALTGGSPTTLSVPFIAPFYQAVFTNGGVAQNQFLFLAGVTS